MCNKRFPPFLSPVDIGIDAADFALVDIKPVFIEGLPISPSPTESTPNFGFILDKDVFGKDVVDDWDERHPSPNRVDSTVASNSLIPPKQQYDCYTQP